MKRSDGAYMTSGEMEQRIREQEETIRRLTVDNDNLHERIRKLEPKYRLSTTTPGLDSLDEYASSLPV